MSLDNRKGAEKKHTRHGMAMRSRARSHHAGSLGGCSDSCTGSARPWTMVLAVQVASTFGRPVGPVKGRVGGELVQEHKK